MAAEIDSADTPEGPLTPAEAFGLALQRFQIGNATGALAICDQLLGSTPDQAPLWQLSGLAAFALERFDDASRRFERAASIAPGDPAHWINLANAQIKQDRDDDAARAFARALSLKPDSAEAEIGLGILARRAGRFEDAVRHADRALARAPFSYQALVNRGRAQHEMGCFAAALVSYDRAIASDPAAAPAHAAKALTLLLTGDLAAGWDAYEWRGEGRDIAARARFTEPEWAGEPLRGGTLLVHAEQGFGDTIQFARFLPCLQARGMRVVAEVQAPVKNLLATLASPVELVARGETLPRFDRHIRLMSLPRVLGVRLDTVAAPIPYLRGDAAAAVSLLPDDPRLTVGLCWAGNPSHENDRNRSIPAEALAPLAKAQNIRWVSVQKGDSGFAASRPNFPLLDLGPRLHDFADLAAIMLRLDLLIAVDSAPAHLMGALGRPVWLLLPDPPDWRWLLNRDDSPWYPTARLFRRAAGEGWEDVVRRVKTELERDPVLHYHRAR